MEMSSLTFEETWKHYRCTNCKNTIFTKELPKRENICFSCSRTDKKKAKKNG